MRQVNLFCAEGPHQLAMAKRYANTLRACGQPTALFCPLELDAAEELLDFDYVIKDPNAALGFLKVVGLVICFTNETSPFCRFSALLSFAAKASNTAIVTVQHGWLQPGLNFQSGMRDVGYRGHVDNSLAVAHFTKQIEWEGPDGIGYYDYDRDAVITRPRPRRERYSALICTNFNFSVYSKEQNFQFMRCISRLSDAMPYLMFYHRGHPAEDTNVEFRRVGMTDLSAFAKFMPTAPYPMASTLVGMDFCITMPSTTALDSLSAGVPVFIFEEKNFIGRMSAFDGALFRTHQELTAKVSRLISDGDYPEPSIKRYDSDKFVAVCADARQTSGEYAIDEATALQYFAYVRSFPTPPAGKPTPPQASTVPHGSDPNKSAA
jgi:hypothetical protein